MKNILISLLCFYSISSYSQNVGVGTTSPSNSLHIVPAGNTDPLKIEGLNIYGNENNLLIVDPSVGIVKHISVDSLIKIMIDSVNTDNQNIDSLTLNGTILSTHIENGNSAAIDLSALTGTSTDDQNLDSLTLNGNILTAYIENGNSAAIDLSAITGTSTDDQNLDSLTLNGNILTAYIENGNSAAIDLSAITGTSTDDQNLSVLPGTSTTSILDMENGNDVTLIAGNGITLSETATSVTIASTAPILTSGEYTPVGTEINVSLDSVRTEVSQYMRIGDYVHVSGTIWGHWNADGNGFVYITLPIASDFISSRDLNGSVNRMSSGPYGSFTDSHNLHADVSGDRILLQVQNAYGVNVRGYQYSLIYRIR